MLLLSNNLYANTETKPLKAFSEDYVKNLIDRAKQLKLAQQPAWLNLLHYKKGWLGTLQSQADDSDFFLSPNGADNAWSELEADLRAFLKTDETDQLTEASSAHAQCRFPARLYWLDSRLELANHLPRVNCEKYDKWKEKHQATQLTLLFPSMHLNNPASMFGHTFIRFDRPGNNQLLSHTLSYAAAVDKSDAALVYAWKGIMGGYNGQFYLKAYFETLQEYSDIEQRDIWEYNLDLTHIEVEQLLRHLWEVRGIKFDYYFLRENCAYRLLALLDVAREDMNLSLNSHPLYAVPVDIVRDIEQAGLINKRVYRPATHNKISQMAEQMTEPSRKAALSIASNERSIKNIKEEFAEKQQAKIYLLADKLVSQKEKKSEKDQDLQLSLLSARSKLSVNAEELEFKYEAHPPELSHSSARWLLAAGEDENQSFYEIGIRPVFHDFLDSTEGFDQGTAISVLDAEFRWYKETQQLKLENLKLFSMRSLVPVKPWVTPVSRQLSIQVIKRDVNINRQITALESQFAAGYSAQVNSLLVYLMAKAQLEYATELEDNHGFQLGAESGLIWGFKNNFFKGQTELNYQILQQVSGEQGDIQRASAGLQLNITSDQALRFEYDYTEYESFDVEQARLSYLHYF